MDGSTLEALFRHLESLQEKAVFLAGKIYAIVDITTYLPVKITFDENPNSADATMWDWLRGCTPDGTLLIFDRGFYDFTEFAILMTTGVAWITRLKKASYRVQRTLTHTPQVTLTHTPQVVDQIIELGHKRGRAKPIIVRLVKIRRENTWYRYITSVTNPVDLPPYLVADLYGRRWHIETDESSS